jgi:Gnt-I system high-affinity gluconate transporter/Gnt-II system L-idonate transporter
MLVLMLVVKLDAFFALLLTSLAVGLLNGMDLLGVLRSVLAGVASTMGSVALILVFGAMLGKLVEESGAAHAITYRLTTLFGPGRVQLAMALAGLLVGLPMLYNAGFLVLIPLVYALAATTGLPLVYLGLPMASALSVTHGFLPPHPAPTYLAFAYHADVDTVLLVGLVAAVPACLIGGVLFSRFVRLRQSAPPAGLAGARGREPSDLPGLGTSLGTALVPMALMLAGAVVDVAAGTAGLDPLRPDADFRAQLAAAVPGHGMRALVATSKFVGNANVALLAGVLVALYTLGIRRGRRMEELMASLARSVSSIATILLVIAAGGAFSQVLRDGGVAAYVSARAAGIHLDPLLLAFGVAAVLRLAVGSATVAGMTTAGMMAPMVAASGVHPELMVLATGAGSLMFSHFNDSGFWMFKEYFGASVRETFLTWSAMEIIVGVVGLSVALLLRAVW